MKARGAILAFASVILLLVTTPARASDPVIVNPNLPSPLATTPILVTAFPFGQNTSFIEIYNQTDQAVSLVGYQVCLYFADELATPEVDEAAEHCLGVASQYLLPDSYLALQNTTDTDPSFVSFQLPLVVQDLDLEKITLIDSAGVETVQAVDFEASRSSYSWLRRDSGSGGHGHQQSNFTQKESPAQINSYGLFDRPTDPPAIEIVEVLARASRCAPDDTSLVCGDYIKLYNPTDQTVDLADYRLRSDSGSSVIGNTFGLNYLVPAQGHLTVSLRDDLSQISLTDSGGYVWLEDRGGIGIYPASMIEYPPFGVDRTGWSWILYDSQWQWTMTPQPSAANQLQLPDPAVDSSCGEGRYRNPDTGRCRNIETDSSDLVPCRPGQERNPATNRCRSVVLAANVLEPCGPGRERNPATNRCRSTAASANTLVPCRPGQERNPATNRCRSIEAAQSDLKPCQPGQERNPATNRCRKVVGEEASLLSSSDSQNGQDSTTAQPTSFYAVLAAIAAVVVGYGIWEWRSEIVGGWGRIRQFIGRR